MFKKIIMALAKKYIEEEKQKQQEEQKEYYEKCSLILSESYKWYYQYLQQSGPTATGIILPLSAEKIAEYNALKALIRIGHKNQIDETYKNCLKHIEAGKTTVHA